MLIQSVDGIPLSVYVFEMRLAVYLIKCSTVCFNCTFSHVFHHVFRCIFNHVSNHVFNHRWSHGRLFHMILSLARKSLVIIGLRSWSRKALSCLLTCCSGIPDLNDAGCLNLGRSVLAVPRWLSGGLRRIGSFCPVFQITTSSMHENPQQLRDPVGATQLLVLNPPTDSHAQSPSPAQSSPGA